MKRILFILIALLSLNASAQYQTIRPTQNKIIYSNPGPTVTALPTPLAQEFQTFTLVPTSSITNGSSSPMRSRWGTFLANGDSGYLQGRSTGSIGIVLSSTAGSFENNPTYFVSKNTANGKVEAIVNGSSYYTLDYDYITFVYLRISVTPTQILFQYSNDDVTYSHDQLISRVESGPLYVKTYYGNNGDTLTELKTFGFQ